MTMVAATTQDEGEGLDALPTVPVECQCPPCRRRRRDRANRVPEELPAKVARLRRTLRAFTRDIDQLADFIGPEDTVAQLAAFAQEAEDALGHAVRSLRLTHGYSWADVARGLGTTRQAAQQRFARYCKED